MTESIGIKINILLKRSGLGIRDGEQKKLIFSKIDTVYLYI